jgi:hypothetical protein
MCSFWFVDFWSYLKDYDLILRIDEDCIIEFSCSDVFDHLQNKVAVYGSWSSPKDVSPCFIHELLAFSADKLYPHKRLQKGPCGPYTNVIGFNLKKLRGNKSLSNYIKEVDSSNNIYIHRWGDHMLWGEILHTLYTNEDHCKLPFIHYYHSSHKRHI